MNDLLSDPFKELFDVTFEVFLLYFEEGLEYDELAGKLFDYCVIVEFGRVTLLLEML